MNFRNKRFSKALRLLCPRRPFLNGAPDDANTPDLPPTDVSTDGEEVDHASAS
jgi:hypothetical protein